jgi:amino acid transporter
MFYVSFAAGMAFGTSSFTMISGLFEITSAPWVVVSIVVAGFICMLISTSVAELASMYPSAPGIRTYLKAAFNNPLSLLFVYLYLIFIVLVAGVESYMFALVVKAIFPSVLPILVVLGLIVFTIVVNCFGLELSHRLQVVTTVGVILCVVVLGYYGVDHAEGTAGLRQFMAGSNLSQIKLLPAAVIMAVYLFTGFEWVTLLGFTPKSYEFKIPISMPLAILTLMVAYTSFAVGIAFHMPRAQISATPVPQVSYFSSLLGNWGVYVAWVLSLCALFSTFNAGIMGGSRLTVLSTH